MARRDIVHGRGQDVDAARDFVEDSLDGQGACPCGGQLDCQRHAAHRTADTATSSSLSGESVKAASCCWARRAKELDCGKVGGRPSVLRVQIGQAVDLDDLLGLELEDTTAR